MVNPFPQIACIIFKPFTFTPHSTNSISKSSSLIRFKNAVRAMTYVSIIISSRQSHSSINHMNRVSILKWECKIPSKAPKHDLCNHFRQMIHRLMCGRITISYLCSVFYPAICKVRIDNFSVIALLNRKNINSSIADDIMVKHKRAQKTEGNAVNHIHSMNQEAKKWYP